MSFQGSPGDEGGVLSRSGSRSRKITIDRVCNPVRPTEYVLGRQLTEKGCLVDCHCCTGFH